MLSNSESLMWGSRPVQKSHLAVYVYSPVELLSPCSTDVHRPSDINHYQITITINDAKQSRSLLHQTEYLRTLRSAVLRLCSIFIFQLKLISKILWTFLQYKNEFWFVVPRPLKLFKICLTQTCQILCLSTFTNLIYVSAIINISLTAHDLWTQSSTVQPGIT